MTASITRVYFALLLGISASIPAHADWLANIVEFTPASGWVQSTPNLPNQPAGVPTIKFIPPDGRHAEIILSLFMSGSSELKVNDLASLKRFNLISATPFLPTPEAKPDTIDLPVADGLGLYMVNEDPSLIGKPVPAGEYRIAATVSLYLAGKFLVHGTILFDSKNSADFQEAIQTIKSAKVRPAVLSAIAKENASASKPKAPPTTAVTTEDISRPGLHGVLHLPAHRFQPSGMITNDNPGYFSYIDDHATMLTGWLVEARDFKGMKSFWAAEKKSLEKNAGIPISDESLKIIHGWNVVSYTVSLGTFGQKNMRACRVVGDTWADLHLSDSRPDASWKDLESLLAEISLSIPAN